MILERVHCLKYRIMRFLTRIVLNRRFRLKILRKRIIDIQHVHPEHFQPVEKPLIQLDSNAQKDIPVLLQNRTCQFISRLG